ncbi:TetR family transcriptional regulator [Streptomyces sp. SID14478]|uniref:TetR/AcrR family transcriptional regulator n=1 Tax=Streptomyces sp. SID14478 TaxID=2706073 RepID=UPI001941E71C|nr:TetR family transcriptional regulator [Streptomyces sp. SID14478]
MNPPARRRAADAITAASEDSRTRLLEAAKDVFAEKGYAGARVQEIADRAGVNKQLINYYFGGKNGIYAELGRRWSKSETELQNPELPYDELVLGYLRNNFADPRGVRLAAWSELTGRPETAEPATEDLADIERRQAEGELSDTISPAMVMLLSQALVMAPHLMPDAVRRIFGSDAVDPGFQRDYTEQLGRVLRLLRA